MADVLKSVERAHQPLAHSVLLVRPKRNSSHLEAFTVVTLEHLDGELAGRVIMKVGRQVCDMNLVLLGSTYERTESPGPADLVPYPSLSRIPEQRLIVRQHKEWKCLRRDTTRREIRSDLFHKRIIALPLTESAAKMCDFSRQTVKIGVEL